MAAAHVLIVDDDIDIAANLRDILTECGHCADVAHNGIQAIELARQQTYAVALLDFKMPGMDGFTLCEKIKSIQPDVAVIMVTACAPTEAAARARKAGMRHILPKPVDMMALMGLVEHSTSGEQ